MSENVLRFRWAAPMPASQHLLMKTVAGTRAQKRWRITDLEARTIGRPHGQDPYFELEWTYGPVEGASINDGRRFISLVLVEALGWTGQPARPERFLQDHVQDFPDVTIVWSGELEQLEIDLTACEPGDCEGELRWGDEAP